MQKWKIKIELGITTWFDVQDSIETKWNQDIKKKEKRALTSVTGPLLLPGYNFLGPGNDMNAIPVSYIDILGQMHDNSYANNKTSTEHYDDTQFIHMLREWGNATEGNG